jgi:type IV pilus assembly protein PilC
MTKNSNSTPATFQYVGINKTGQKVTGTINARNLTLAKVNLRKQDILVHKITQKRLSLLKKITSIDITLFSRQLATLIETGIPLIQAMDTLSKGELDYRLKNLIEQMKQDIETGLTFAETLGNHPMYFNALFCNLIDAGEKSGTLDIMLHKISYYREHIESVKKKIKNALIYPIAVIIIAFIITGGLLIFIVPQFETLFKDFGADLPALTKTVVHISKFCQSYGHLIFGCLGTAVYLIYYFKKNVPDFAHRIDRILLKLPFIGNLMKKAAIARFSRTLSITFASGLSLVEALKSVAGATGNSIFLKATESIKNELVTGQQMSRAMQNTQLFPNMAIQMVAVGEESGSLEKMLSKVADFYEEEVDNLVDSFISLLEPIIISILGILVGALVIAMYLPIFKLGSAL